MQEAVRESVEPGGVTVEFNGDAEFPPLEQGIQELLGLLAALIVLLAALPRVRLRCDPPSGSRWWPWAARSCSSSSSPA